jgi:endonuclease/exonuclease/phosphatase family metal-dependent hydrolase
MKCWLWLPRLLLLLLAARLSAAAPVAGSDSLWTVMTFNLRYAGGDSGEHAWEARREAVANRVQAAGADLLATQECLARQADDLRRLLPEYGLAGVGRDDGDREGEMCALLWRRERFLKLEEGHRWHSEPADRPGRIDADAACVRMFSWVLLAERAAPFRQVVFVSTHLDHVGAVARQRGARRLREWLEQRYPDTPLLVAGDFNAPAGPGSEPWEILTAPSGPRPLTDVFRALHAPGELAEGTFHGFQDEDQPERIDWILASPEFQPQSAWIDRERVANRQPSDHHPVVVTLEPPAGRDVAP